MTITTTSLGEICSLIRENINIVDFCEEVYNAAFFPGNKGWYNTNCLMPDHSDNNPSFGVNIEKCSFHCFGCGQTGSIIDLVMKTEDMTLKQAVDFLLDYLNIKPEVSAPKFYNIKKLLKAKAAFNSKEVLLDAKIKQIKKEKPNLNTEEYFSKICSLFSSYGKMDDEDFKHFVYEN